MRTPIVRTWALLLGSLTVGCLALPDVPVGVCGNQIVDPGEDCDGAIARAHPKGLTCGLAGTASACRFDCSAALDLCPGGYKCGADGICRQPSGQFEALTSVAASSSLVMMADFDGDLRSDLLTLDYDSGQIDVRFFERDGIVTRSFSTPSDGIVPAVGVLDATQSGALRDLAYGFTGGIGVVRGQPDRGFQVTAYPIFTSSLLAGATAVATNVLDGKPYDPAMPDPMSPKLAGDEILILYGKNGYSPNNATAANPNFATKPVFSLPVAAEPGSRVLVGNLDTDLGNSPCSEIVLPEIGAPRVHIVTPCYRPAGQPLGWNDGSSGFEKTYAPVTLPDGSAQVTRVVLAHLNPTAPNVNAGKDRFLDLLIEAHVGSATLVYAAYGLGDGTFQSTVPAQGQPPPDGMAALYDAGPVNLYGLPLAVGDVNGDGVPDFVEPNGLFQSTGPAVWTLAAEPLVGAPWSEAVLLDLNSDGRVDFVAGGAGVLGVQLFTRTVQGLYNPEFIPTEGPATRLVTGDFDGDLNVDVAFRSGPAATAAEVQVLFGRNGELPAAPVSVARLDRVDLLVSGANLSKRVPENAYSDLLVLDLAATAQSATVFVGRPDRSLEAPYYFVSEVGSIINQPVVAALATGRFRTASDPVLTDLAALVLVNLQDMSTPPNQDAQLWLLPPEGAAQFPAPAKLKPMPQMLPTSSRWSSALMGVMDLDRDGVDDVIVLVPDAPTDVLGMSASKTSTLYVGGVEGAASYFDVTKVATPLKVGLWDRAGGRRNVPLCVARIDKDKFLDLVVLGVPDGKGSGARPIVFWGTGNKDHPFEDDPVVLDVPAGDADEVHGFTCLDLDADGFFDVVAVTQNATYSTVPRATDGTDGPGVRAGGAGSRALTLTALLDPRNQKNPGPLPGGASVTTGDIDDDYIPDLVISNANSATLYRGKAVIP
jgi:hypothetical protein